MKATAIAILGVLGMSCAHAETGIKAVNNQIGLSIGAQHIDYVEEDTYGATNTGVLDSEKGSQPGIKFHYGLQGDQLGIKDLYFKASYAYAKGKSHYDGYLQNLSTGALTPYTSSTHVSSTDAQLKLGKGFVFGQQAQLTPYVAYNYREWERDSSRDTYGYLEMYSHDAVSFGLLGQYAITPKLVASFDASIGKILSAKMEVEHYTRFDLGNRPLYILEMGLDYALSPKLHLFGNYAYMQYRYGESNIVAGFIEPNSKTKLHQIYLGTAYGF